MIESNFFFFCPYTQLFYLSNHYIFIREDRAPEYSLFVGDLSADIDETFLLVKKKKKSHLNKKKTTDNDCSPCFVQDIHHAIQRKS